MAGKTYGGKSGGGTSWFNQTFRPKTNSSGNSGGSGKSGGKVNKPGGSYGGAGDYKHSWNAAGPGYGGDADIYRSMVGSNQTQAGWNAFRAGINDPNLLPPMGPAQPMNLGGGGGGGGYGGGGGGGGGNAMTQAMFDQMVAALGRQGPTLTSGSPLTSTPLAATLLNLPAFKGQNIAAFNATPYTQAQQSLTNAVRADRANVATNAQQTTNALNANYSNDYANQAVTPGATAAPVGAALQGTAGATASNDANQQAAAGANAANGDSQAAFSNLLNVLAANANQSQQSRLSQVAMDKGTALNSIGAQQLGLGAGINQSRANAQTQWQQQDNERRNQNSMLAQQWAREQAMQNNQMTNQTSQANWQQRNQNAQANWQQNNQTSQANWQQRNQQLQTTLQPILDLIASTGGTKLDMSALTKLLAGTR